MKQLNIIDFDTPFGLRSTEIWSGNILEQNTNSDLIVVSLFGKSLEPTPSSLIGQISSKGIDAIELYKKRSFDLRGSLNTWLSPEISKLPAPRLLFLEMRRREDKKDTIIEAFENLFLSLHILEKKGYVFKIITLPVLGTGDQGLAEESIVPELIKMTRRILFELKHTEKIKFIEKDIIKAGLISSEINERLGRNKSFDNDDDMIVYARSQVKNLLDRIDINSSPVLIELYDTINKSPVKPWEIGTHTRRTLEWILCRVSAKGINAYEKISYLKYKNIPDITISYLHMARVIGNSAVHIDNSDNKTSYIPSKDDITINLLCIERILSFYIETID